MALVAEHIGPGVELDPARAIDEVEEGRLAVAAAGEHPAGDPVGGVGLGAVGDSLVRGPDLGDLGPGLEAVRERLDAPRAQALELLAPLGEKVGAALVGGVAHAAASLTPTAAGRCVPRACATPLPPVPC